MLITYVNHVIYLVLEFQKFEVFEEKENRGTILCFIFYFLFCGYLSLNLYWFTWLFTLWFSEMHLPSMFMEHGNLFLYLDFYQQHVMKLWASFPKRVFCRKIFLQTMLFSSYQTQNLFSSFSKKKNLPS